MIAVITQSTIIYFHFDVSINIQNFLIKESNTKKITTNDEITRIQFFYILYCQDKISIK